MPTYLEDLVLEEVSIVDRPANIGARVVLMKRDSTPTIPRNNTGATHMATTEEKIAELEARAVTAEKAAAEADARAKKAEADAAALSATQKAASDLAAFAPTLPALLRKQFDAMAHDDQVAFKAEYCETAKDGGGRLAKALDDTMKANQELADRLAKFEHAGELEAIKAELAPIGKAIPNMDEFAPALLKLRKADPDAAKALIENTKALAAQQKTAALFSLAGRDGSGAGSATAKISKAANALRAANPSLTAEKAEAMALEQNPALYAEYLSEQSAA